MPERPLWTCPACGRRFVTANSWHSCHVGDLDEFFAGHEHLRPLFDAYVALARELGEFDVEVVRTRISFVARVRFAGVVRLRRDAIVASFWLKREVHHQRLRRVDHVGGSDWVYETLLRDESDLDDDLSTWLAEAYAVGRQEST